MTSVFLHIQFFQNSMHYHLCDTSRTYRKTWLHACSVSWFQAKSTAFASSFSIIARPMPTQFSLEYIRFIPTTLSESFLKTWRPIIPSNFAQALVQFQDKLVCIFAINGKFNNLNHNERSLSSITFSSSRINGKEILKTDPWPRTLSTVIFPW